MLGCSEVEFPITLSYRWLDCFQGYINTNIYTYSTVYVKGRETQGSFFGHQFR